MNTQTLTPLRLALAENNLFMRPFYIEEVLKCGHYTMDIVADDGKDLIQQLEKAEHIPHICLLDLCMPNLNGYKTLPILKKRWPSMKVLIITGHFMRFSMVRSIKAGANAYVAKVEFMQNINTVLQDLSVNDYHFSTGMVKSVYESIVSGKSIDPHITDQEMEFIKQCCTEYTYKEIANVMKVSPRTIDGYRDSLFKKLEVRSRQGITSFAVRAGIVYNRGD